MMNKANRLLKSVNELQTKSVNEENNKDDY